jgi:ribonuclease P protein component, eubacterial
LEQQDIEKEQKPVVTYLKKRTEFLTVAKGRRYHTENVTLQGFSRKTDALGLRVGLTVTKRVGNAVERNRIKRRLREAIAQSLYPFFYQDIDIVVVARRPVLLCDFEKLKGDLAKAFSNVVRFKKPQTSKHSINTVSDNSKL